MGNTVTFRESGVTVVMMMILFGSILHPSLANVRSHCSHHLILIA